VSTTESPKQDSTVSSSNTDSTFQSETAPSDRSAWIWQHRIGIVLVIFIIGFLCRAVCLYHNDSHPNYDSDPYTDEIHYRQLAENLIQFKQFAAYSQGFFSVSTRAPVYPAVLSLTEFLTNFSPHSHHFLNLALDCLNILLIFTLGYTVSGWFCGAVSMGIYALFGPPFVYLKTSTPEILALTLLLVSVLHLYCFLSNPSSRFHAVGFALCYSILIHTRPAFLLLLPIILVGTFWFLRDSLVGKLSSRLNFGLLIALVVIFCAPWLLRNYQRHGTMVPVCTLAGWHLGAHARSLDELPVDLMWNYIYDPSRRGYAEGDYFRETTSQSVQMALQQPVQTTVTGLARIVYSWGFEKPYIRLFLPR